MAWILASKDQLLGGLARGNASYRGFFLKNQNLSSFDSQSHSKKIACYLLTQK